MGITKKILVLFVALSVLNQSIDFDYVTFGFGVNQKAADYDDVDSILELLVEKIVGDDSFTDESNDDSGIPQQKGIEKNPSPIQYFEQTRKIKLVPSRTTACTWFTGMDHSNKICKGYSEINSPPPKA